MHQSLAIATLLLLCSSHVLPGQELLIRYTFDEGSGAALDTGSSPPANGNLGATATRTDDTPGMASPFALDLREAGTDSILTAGDPAKIDTLESFTLTTWIKLTGLNSEQGGSGNVRLLAKQAGGAFNGISWNLNGPNEGDRDIDNFRTGLFVGGDVGFDFAFAEEDVFADEWAFLAVSYDGNEFIENTSFYFGNETTETVLLGDDFPESIDAGFVESTAGEANFGIGFTAASSADFSVDGFQDDVRVYNGVLSLAQLEAVRLENLGSPSLCDPSTGGDLDGSGTVDFADFLTLSANFGTAVDSHLEGDIDCNGTVEFADFLTLSSGFGQSPNAIEAVPEPTTSLLSLIAALFVLPLRRRR